MKYNLPAKTTRVWLLTDDKTENIYQSKALAEALNMSFELKVIKFNFLKYLPNSWLKNKRITVDEYYSSDITPPYPDIVISAGKYTSPIALSFKKSNPGIKVIQILKPREKPEKFDLVIMPEYEPLDSAVNNVYRSIGAMNKITTDLLEREKQKFRDNFPQCAFAVFGAYIGGKYKGCKISEEEANYLAKMIGRVVDNHGAQLFLMFAADTPEYVKNIFYKHFYYTTSAYIHDPEMGGYDPYWGVVAIANSMIVTGDAITRCSEVITAGTPLYIYNPTSLNSAKHDYFFQRLDQLKLAKFIDLNTSYLENYKYKPLSETKQIASYVKEKLLYEVPIPDR